MRTPYWSDQKYGGRTGPGSAAPPDSSAATAAAGRSWAPVQCSTLRCAPAAGSYQAAQSPTATTAARLVRPSAPHFTPFSSITPDPASQSTQGLAPTPTTTVSAGRL